MIDIHRRIEPHPLLEYLSVNFPATRGHKFPDDIFRPLTYLAVPYSFKHEDPEQVRMTHQFRFLEATKAAAWLMNLHAWNVFSPITHSHPLHKYAAMRGDWEFWKKIDTEFLQISARIIVLGLEGWRTSAGVTAELKISDELGLPKYFLQKNDNPDSPYTLHLETSHYFFEAP